MLTLAVALTNAHTHDTRYTANMRNITTTLVAAAAQANATLLFVTTTIPGGASEPVTSPDHAKVIALNTAATQIVSAHSITVIDLYATMKACGAACDACKPHCQPEGYQYLVTNGLYPAVKKALHV
jgi:hypothetical protein